MLVGLPADIHRPFGPGTTPDNSGGPSKMRGLYPCLAHGKQELQKGADARRPGRLVVLAALHTLVVQVAIKLPAFAKQNVAEALHVIHNARSLARADIQPNARQRTCRSSGGKAVNHSFVPPH